METLRNIWLNYGWSSPFVSTLVVMIAAGALWWIFGGIVYVSTPKTTTAAEKVSATSWADDPPRKAIIEKLRLTYVRTHPDCDPAIKGGREGPPTDWTNRQLKEMGEKWTYEPLGQVSGGPTGFSIKRSKGSSITNSSIEDAPAESLKGYEIEDSQDSHMSRNRITVQPSPQPTPDRSERSEGPRKK